MYTPKLWKYYTWALPWLLYLQLLMGSYRTSASDLLCSIRFSMECLARSCRKWEGASRSFCWSFTWKKLWTKFVLEAIGPLDSSTLPPLSPALLSLCYLSPLFSLCSPLFSLITRLKPDGKPLFSSKERGIKSVTWLPCDLFPFSLKHITFL